MRSRNRWACRVDETTAANHLRLTGTSHPLNVKSGDGRVGLSDHKGVGSAVALPCWRRFAQVTTIALVGDAEGAVRPLPTPKDMMRDRILGETRKAANQPNLIAYIRRRHPNTPPILPVTGKQPAGRRSAVFSHHRRSVASRRANGHTADAEQASPPGGIQGIRRTRSPSPSTLRSGFP